MVDWFIDRSNKIPLYLQLKDLIKYYISTGVLRDEDALPGVNTLAQELGINFDTVRKAYKDLEKEGLLSVKRGMKTIVKLKSHSVQTELSVPNMGAASPAGFKQMLFSSVKGLLKSGKSVEEVKILVSEAIESEVRSEDHFIIFTECNSFQAEMISRLLRDYLEFPVKPVVLTDMAAELAAMNSGTERILAVVTTGFHLSEVQKVVEGLGISVHLLVTNLSPDTRQQIKQLGKGLRVGFICRDQSSIPLYTDIIKAELGLEVNLSSSIMSDRTGTNKILQSADVLLAWPPVFLELKKIAPENVPVFNLLDRVDPMSLRLLKNALDEKVRLKSAGTLS